MLRAFLRSVDYLILDILSMSVFRSCSRREDDLSEIFLANKIFMMLLEGTTLNCVVPPAVVVEEYFSAPGRIESCWSGFGHFTQGKPSMAQ